MAQRSLFEARRRALAMLLLSAGWALPGVMQAQPSAVVGARTQAASVGGIETAAARRRAEQLILIRFLKTTSPGLQRLGRVYGAHAPRADLSEARTTAAVFDVRVEPYSATSGHFAALVARMKADGVQALDIVDGALPAAARRRLVRAAFDQGLPVTGDDVVLAAGGVASFGRNSARTGRSDEPYGVQPRALTINAASLARLSLAVPSSLLDETASPGGRDAGAPTAAQPIAARRPDARPYRVALLAGENERGMDEVTALLEAANLRPGIDVVYLRRVALAAGASAPSPGYDIARDVRDVLAFSPDLIVQMDTPAGVALKKDPETARIPVVGFSGDAIATHEACSYRSPGLNFTGASPSPYGGLVTLWLLKSLIPRLRVIGDIVNPSDPTADSGYSAFAALARLAGVEVRRYPAAAGVVDDALFDRMTRDGVQAVNVALHGPSIRGEDIGRSALRHNLPAVGGAGVAKGGGLASIVSRFSWKALSPAMLSVLAGADPGAIRVQRGAWPTLTLNLGVAATLGLRLPEQLVADANDLIN